MYRSHRVDNDRGQCYEWQTRLDLGLNFCIPLQNFYVDIQDDSKRWTQIRTSIFPELYVVCE